MVVRAAQRLDIATGLIILQFASYYMLALTLGVFVEFLTDTPREDSRGLCHALCLIAAVTLFFSTPEQFLESLDITTVLSTVILLRAFYDVTGTYAHPIELVAGWIAVISVGCALTTSNGWLALVLIMTGFI